MRFFTVAFVSFFLSSLGSAHAVAGEKTGFDITPIYGNQQGTPYDVRARIKWRITQLLRYTYLYPVNFEECAEKLLDQIMEYGYGEGAQEGDRAKRSGEGSRTSWACLDKNSKYLTRQERQYLLESVRGERKGGTGIEVEKTGGGVAISFIFPESPAERKGLRKGDVLLSAQEGGSGTFFPFNDAFGARKMLRGEKGSTIILHVRRGNELKVFSVVREDIRFRSVWSQRIGGIPYISIRFFNKNTPSAFERAMDVFAEERNISHVIIDVQDNPGGRMYSALEILYYFARNEDDIFLVSRNRNYKETIRLRDLFWVEYVFSGNEQKGTLRAMLKSRFTDQTTLAPKMPGKFKDIEVFVLVNGYSASAAEIFAARMKEWGHTVVGETTYGKGTVQRIFQFAGGDGLKLTTAEFFVGNMEVRIQGRGVVPTHTVRECLSPDDPRGTDGDCIFQEAIRLLEKK